MNNQQTLSSVEKQVIRRLSVAGFGAATAMFFCLLLINGQLNQMGVALFKLLVSGLEVLMQAEIFLSGLTFVWPALFLTLMLGYLGANAAFTLKVNEKLNQVNPADEESIFIAFDESCKICVKQSKVNGVIAVVLIALAVLALINGLFKDVQGVKTDMGYTAFCVATGMLVLYGMCSSVSAWIIPQQYSRDEHLENEASNQVHRVAKGIPLGSKSTKCSIDDLNIFNLSRFALRHKEYTERLYEVAAKHQ